jgi:adenylate kinase
LPFEPKPDLGKGIVVAVTGTPGVGKTSLCSFLSRKYGYAHLEVGALASEKELYSGYDEVRGVPIADTRGLRREVRRMIRRGDFDVLLIDGHYAHELVSKSDILGVFVLRLDPLRLFQRTNKLSSMRKAKENSLSEFLGTVSTEARQRHSHVADLDVTQLSIAGTAARFTACLAKRPFAKTPPVEWMRIMGEKRIRRFLKVVETQVLLG